MNTGAPDPDGTGLSPFDLLVQIDRKYRVLSPALPRPVQAGARWDGVAFRLRGFEFVVPLHQIVEIVDMPVVSPMPGVKPWVIGLANMRGSLLPVIDLGRFLFEDEAAAQGRLLVAKLEGSPVGLRVDAVHGMRHFDEDQRQQAPAQLPPPLRPFVNAAYADGERVWPVFDMGALLSSRDFLEAAA